MSKSLEHLTQLINGHPHVYKGALSENPVDVVSIEKLGRMVDKLQVEGVVSRNDVEPYLDKFPPYIALEDFDEEPSTRNVEMALESFAGFLKAGLAVAIIGALGYLVYHLISSRKKGEKLGEDATHSQELINALGGLEEFVLTNGLPDKEIPAGTYQGKNLINASVESISELKHSLEKLAGNSTVHVLFGNSRHLSSALETAVTPEKASQKPAIDRLARLLPTMGERLSRGEEAAILEEIKEINKMTAELSLGESLKAIFSKEIPAVKENPSTHVSYFSLAVIDEIEKFFERRGSSKSIYADKVIDAVSRFKGVSLLQGSQIEPGRTRVSFEQIAASCKEANQSCEKLKDQATKAQVNTEIEAALNEAILLIGNNIKVTERIMGLVTIEQADLQSYLSFNTMVTKDLQSSLEELVRKEKGSSELKQLAKLLTAVQQAAKKIRN